MSSASLVPIDVDVPPQDQLRPLWDCPRLVTPEETRLVAARLGLGWQQVGRELQFSQAALDQFQQDTRSHTEAIQRMLFRWTQWKDHKATVKRLTRALFLHKEYAAIQVLRP